MKTLETSLAEREAMIRIFQTNKTVNNSNDILNKALVSGGVPGTATSSQGAAAAASGQLAAAQLSAAAAAAAAATSDPLTQAQIRSALLTSTASPIPPPVTTSSSAAVQAAVAAAAAAAAAQQATASPAMAGSLVHHHQKQLSTPLPLTSAGLSAANAAASAAGSGHHPLAGQLPHPHHAQFKSISLNSTPTRNLTSLPYSSPALQHSMSPFAQGFYFKVHLNNAQKILGLYKICRCIRIRVLILPCTMMNPAFYCRRRVTRRVARRRTPRPRRSWGHRAVPHPQRRHASAEGLSHCRRRLSGST